MRITPVLRLMLLVPLLAACIGRATPPEQVKLTQQQNEVLGKFARQVGEKEINILLKDPNDATLPGIPVGDLLYILSKVNEDKLITLVKGIGATSTLELILAIKRVGCTRANDIPYPGQYTFDARDTLSINTCKWNHFHLPNIMVQLLNGANTSGLTTLIDTVKHSYTNLGLAANKPLLVTTPGLVAATPYDATVRHYEFLMKLAYIVVGFDTPTVADPNLSSDPLIGPPKLYNLMNLTMDGRDMVFLLDSFDVTYPTAPSTTCPNLAPLPTAPANVSCVRVSATNILETYDTLGNIWTDLENGRQMAGLKNLLELMAQVTDTSKMGTLVNGNRTTRYDTTQDQDQVIYFIDRLKVVIEHPMTTACAATIAGSGTLGTPAQRALQDYGTPLGGGNPTWNTKLATLINTITNVTRMMDLVYRAEDGFYTSATTRVSVSNCPNRGIDNLLVLVNNINTDAAAHAAVPVNAAGNQATNNELITAAYMIDNVALDPANNLVAKRNKVKYLVENIGTTFDALKLACYSAAGDNLGAGTTCDDLGLINQVAAGSKINDASVGDLTAAGQKLVNMTGQINEIEDMRFLVRKVKMKPLTDLVAGLLIAGTANTANLINQINGDDCWETPVTYPGPVVQPLAGIIGATVTSGAGANYTGQTTVTLSGGATGRPLLTATNRVGGIVILTEGNNVTYNSTPPITITDAGGGTGSTATAVTGRCVYNAPTDFRGFPSVTSTGALGLGKMVNIVNHLSGSITNLVTMINNVTDGQKLGILINGINRSSNLVGLMNATVDPARSNNATITDMVNLINNITRQDTYKLFHMIESFGNAQEINNLDTIPSGDHDLVAQLIASYNQTNIATTSGVGYSAMATLVSSLSLNGGGSCTAGTVTFAGGGGSGAAATLDLAATGTVTDITFTAGAGCTSIPTLTVASPGGGGTTAVAVAYMSGGSLQRISILDPGSGYTAPPAVAVGAAGCTTAPTAQGRINGAGSIRVTNPGSGYTTNPSIGFPCGQIPQPYATVSGSLATLNNLYPGKGFVATQTCPVVGAGGSGATVNITSVGAAGDITALTISAGGSGYGVGKIVKIGGNAEIIANVNAAGAITGYTITNSGCGYTGTPVLTLYQATPTCTAGVPTATMGASGQVSAIGGGLGGTGCKGVKVGVSYVTHSDAGSAIVGSVTGGVLTSVSVSEPAVNAAQLVQLLDRDGTGQGVAITMNNSSPLVGGISAREAMVRLLNHGVTPSLASSKSFFNASLGASGPAGGVAGNYLRDWPGAGPQHIAGAILNNVGGAPSTSTQTLINLMNDDTIDLVDTVILLGCGDRSTYSNGWTAFTWQQLCTESGPGIW